MKIFLTILISLIVGFLVGFVPVTMKKAELKTELADCGDNLKNVYERLEISEAYRIALNEFIGAYEAASNKNFGIAQTRVISALDRSKSLADKGLSPFAEIAPQRDGIVSILAKGGTNAEPEMKMLLFSLYKDNQSNF